MQSFWEEERKNYKEYESIRNDMRASVCVIGGGARFPPSRLTSLK